MKQSGGAVTSFSMLLPSPSLSQEVKIKSSKKSGNKIQQQRIINILSGYEFDIKAIFCSTTSKLTNQNGLISRKGIVQLASGGTCICCAGGGRN